MERPENSQGQDTSRRKDRWAAFRGLAWWEIVLVLVPLALIGVGGLVGGLFGGAGAALNLSLARRRLPAGAKVAAMLGVGIAAAVLYFVVAATIRSLLPH